MGFHVCPKPDSGYIHGSDKPIYPNTSSGDNEVTFDNGRSWRFPDALVYYIYDCGYTPPQEFIDDVENAAVTNGHRFQTRGGGHASLSDTFTKESGGNIAYLSPEDVNECAKAPWEPSETFKTKLAEITRDLGISASGPSFGSHGFYRDLF